MYDPYVREIAVPIEESSVHVPPTEPAAPLSGHLLEVVHTWARSQYRLVVLSAEFADSHEWVVAGSPTAAHWLAAAADVETCTTREWIRIGRRLRELHATAAAFEAGRLSYSKVRTLTRVATLDSEAELLDIALEVPAANSAAPSPHG